MTNEENELANIKAEHPLTPKQDNRPFDSIPTRPAPWSRPLHDADEHREQAREPERIKVCIRLGKEDWIGVAYANETADPSAIHEYVSAAALSSRDAEVREVLEGLITKHPQFVGEHPCWCPQPDTRSRKHAERCVATRALYTKLQPKEVGDADDETISR